MQEYVQARIRAFAGAFAQKFCPELDSATLQQATEQLLLQAGQPEPIPTTLDPSPTVDTVTETADQKPDNSNERLQLVFKHECM